MSDVDADSRCRAVRLQCEGRENPLGIGTTVPRFSWWFHQAGQNRAQSAYRIVVASSANAAAQGDGDCWDSGRVVSPQTHLVRYAGLPLGSRSRCYYRVSVWDADGVGGQPSDIGRFEVALLREEDWKASWIGGGSLLRREFMVASPVSSARLYVTGLGYHLVWINGGRVGDGELSPSYTDYEKRVEYLTYDVSSMLRTGENALAIMLGGSFFDGRPRAIAQLEVTLENGKHLTVCTDERWKCASGPIVASSIYHGETYDARLQRRGWQQAGYDDHAWQAVALVPSPGAQLVPSEIPPIRVVETRRPVSIRRRDDERYIVDFGVNSAGRVRIWLAAEAGREIRLRHGELLEPDGSVNTRTLRSAEATDRYIAGGRGQEEYSPSFTYHGFRYVQVENYPGELTDADIVAEHMRSDVRETGTFSCSKALFNQIHTAMKRTLGSNLYSIPTDCCQRDERQGWLGDGHICAEACIANFDMYAFYRKWLQDIHDVQDPETGALTACQAPAWFPSESLTWGMAFFLIPWYLYRHYGDLDVLRASYPSLRHYFQYLDSNSEQGQLRIRDIYGDWLAVEQTPTCRVVGACYYWAATLMGSIAKAVEEKDQAREYCARAAEICAAYNSRYFHHESGYYGENQTISRFGNSFPLYLGMVPQEAQQEAMDNLLWDITMARGTAELGGGFFSTKYTIELLSREGRNDVVYDLFDRRAYPGWGFMIEHGATAIWERWEHKVGWEMNSHNHPPFCSPDTWFYHGLAGIDEGREEDGRRLFAVRPFFHPELSFVKASRETPWGRIAIRWERNASQIAVALNVPANCHALLELPGSERGVPAERHELASGEHRITVAWG